MRQRKGNDLIREFLAAQENTAFVGLWNEMPGADGQRRPELHVADRLHSSDAGYKLRAATIRPFIE